MAFETVVTNHLVKSEDLNHHGTLFAGRCAEWFVESGFVAVAHRLEPRHIVCLEMHGMKFLHPVKAGSVLRLESCIVRCGRSTLTVYIRFYALKTDYPTFSEGFMTFCYVDENTRPVAHGLTVEPETEEERRLYDRAVEILSKR